MSKITEQIKATFQKFGIDPSAHGIKFEEETAAPVAELTFSAEGVLQDGTAIYSTADAWGIGADIYTKDADGNPVPLMAGEYILQDGTTTVVVDEAGMITDIGNTATSQQDMSSEDLIALVGSLSEQISAQSERIAALEGDKTSMAAQVEASNTEIKSLKSELAAVKKAPATTSIKSQEFKKNAVTISPVTNSTFGDFMDDIRNKKKS